MRELIGYLALVLAGMIPGMWIGFYAGDKSRNK
jgi:hypothetical protein